MARKAPPAREASLQKSGIQFLKDHGIWAYRRNTGAFAAEYHGQRRFLRFAEPGQADVWGILPDGRHIEVEFKRKGQRPTLAQARWLLSCNIRCPAFWVDNLDALETTIKAILRGAKIAYRVDQRKYGDEWGPSSDYNIEFAD